MRKERMETSCSRQMTVRLADTGGWASSKVSAPLCLGLKDPFIQVRETSFAMIIRVRGYLAECQGEMTFS